MLTPCSLRYYSEKPIYRPQVHLLSVITLRTGKLIPSPTLFSFSSPMQHFDFPLPSPLKVFEMLVVPEQEYPLVCVAISEGTEHGQVVCFETINLNSCSSWFTEIGTNNHQVDAIHVTQLERDTVLGRLKSNKKLASELSFDFCIGAVDQVSPRAKGLHLTGDAHRLSRICQQVFMTCQLVRLLKGRSFFTRHCARLHLEVTTGFPRNEE
ncbi:hypothetical protein GOODEAATRI_007017 [Goodea atripinnis]|uniref:Uncharacterized protein n=1 Tax=Goodea atripinnis TaxID=208336 RepID=A0ABV0P2G1_9TELE